MNSRYIPSAHKTESPDTRVCSLLPAEMAVREVERARGSFIEAMEECDRMLKTYGVSTQLWYYWYDVWAAVENLRIASCKASKED